MRKKMHLHHQALSACSKMSTVASYECATYTVHVLLPDHSEVSLATTSC